MLQHDRFPWKIDTVRIAYASNDRFRGQLRIQMTLVIRARGYAYSAPVYFLCPLPPFGFARTHRCRMRFEAFFMRPDFCIACLFRQTLRNEKVECIAVGDFFHRIALRHPRDVFEKNDFHQVKNTLRREPEQILLRVHFIDFLSRSCRVGGRYGTHWTGRCIQGKEIIPDAPAICSRIVIDLPPCVAVDGGGTCGDGTEGADWLRAESSVGNAGCRADIEVGGGDDSASY